MAGQVRKPFVGQSREAVVARHLDVLKNIETVLVRAHRLSDAVDDAACREAVESCLAGKAPRQAIAALVADKLSACRSAGNLPDRAWRDALRVVADSVRLHSQCLPRQTDYLSFVDHFVA
jgi:hypothetical protein